MKSLFLGLIVIVIAFMGFYWFKLNKISSSLDINGNGMIELVEAGALQKPIFNNYDQNQDGSLQKSELLNYVIFSILNNIKVKYRSFNLPSGYNPDTVSKHDIQSSLDTMVDVLSLPGAVLITATSGGEIMVWVSGELNEHSQVPVASASKWVSSAIIMRLVEEKVLSLDARIDSYIPWDDNEWGKVTLRQLLNFTAGAPTGHLLTFSPEIELEEMVSSIAAMKPSSEPGVEFTYGGITMQIAAYVAELQTGMSWNELFERYISLPLGMQSSTYIHPIFFGGHIKAKTPNVAAGLHTSAYDYIKFLNGIANPTSKTSLLSKTSVRAIEHDYTSKLVQNFRPPGAAANWSYGLGLWCERVENNECEIVNSAGAYGTFPWINRETGSYGVLVTLGSIKNVIPFALQLREMTENLAQVGGMNDAL